MKWWITPKWNQEVKQISVNGTSYGIKHYSPHPTLDFALFKIDEGNDAQRHQLIKLKGLATSEDLKNFDGWVTSVAFIPGEILPLSNLAENLLRNYSKPFSALSKIEKQEMGRLILNKGKTLQQTYKEIWPNYKIIINMFKKSIQHLDFLLKDPTYKQKYLQNQALEISNKIDQLRREINKHQEVRDKITEVTNQFPDHKHWINSSELAQEELKNSLTFKNLQTEKTNLQDHPNTVWQKHLTDLNKQKQGYVQMINQLDQPLNDSLKSHVIDLFFYSSYMGVADQADQGGLILVVSKESHLANNTMYINDIKIAGLTNIKKGDKDYIPGVKSTAIDLTTPTVRTWISQTIDKYHGDIPTNISKSKKPSEEPNPTTKRIE